MVKNKRSPQSADIYAPPTPEELGEDDALFAPPTTAELGNASDARADKKPNIFLSLARQSARKRYGPDIAEGIEDFALPAVDKITMGNLQYSPQFKESLKASEERSPNLSTLGKAAGFGGLGIAGALVPGGVIGQIGVGALEGFLQKPEGVPPEEEMRARGMGAAFGGGLGAIMAGGGKLAKQGGDWIMQKAVGGRDYAKGMGTALIEEGIGGSRGMMKGQLSRRQRQITDQMNKAAAKIPGKFDASSEAASRVSGIGDTMRIGSVVSSLDEPLVNKIDDYAAEVAGRGQESMADIVARRTRAGQRANWEKKTMNPDVLRDALSKAEQYGYSSRIKQINPDFIPLDRRYGAVAEGLDNINLDQPMYQGWGPVGTTARAAGVVGGGMVAGAPGVVAGLVGAGLSTPMGQSLAAHLLHRSGQAAPILTPAMINALVNDLVKEQIQGRPR